MVTFQIGLVPNQTSLVPDDLFHCQNGDLPNRTGTKPNKSSARGTVLLLQMVTYQTRRYQTKQVYYPRIYFTAANGDLSNKTGTKPNKARKIVLCLIGGVEGPAFNSLTTSDENS